MNIFWLDNDPRIAAKLCCDQHVKKQIPESCQMLANCFTLSQLMSAPVTKDNKFRSHSYQSHPVSLWVLKSRINAMWLLEHVKQLCREFKERYNKQHFCLEFVAWVNAKIQSAKYLSDAPPTVFQGAFKQGSECLKDPDFESLSVPQKYIEYIKKDKKFATWKNGKPTCFK